MANIRPAADTQPTMRALPRSQTPSPPGPAPRRAARVARAYRIGFALLALGALGLAVGACLSFFVPALNPPGSATAAVLVTRLPMLANLSGTVWADTCDQRQPSAGACQVTGTGAYRANGVFDPAESGLGGVVVALGPGACPAAAAGAVAATTVTTGAHGRYQFSSLDPGTYCLSIDAGQAPNTLPAPGQWSAPATGTGLVAAQTIVLAAGEDRRDVNFGWDVVEPEHTPTPTAASATPTAACTDKAAFLADVTVRDNTSFSPGTAFVKTWRLLNTGTCTWTTSYALIFAGGERLGGPTEAALPAAVAPGTTVDLSVSLTAPTTPGAYAAQWQLRNAAGAPFGIGANADQAFWVRIVVGATATPTATQVPTTTATAAPGVWRGAYYANRTLSGAAAAQRDDSAINFNWGLGAPLPGLPSDSFSVRWTNVISVETGLYRFTLAVDDGARLFVDNVLVIDQWRDGARREITLERRLDAGVHTLRLDYYEAVGEAAVQLRWEKLSAYPDWKGEYWANASLSGSPALTRNDPSLDFSWAAGAPAAGLPADNFSARWTRQLTFDPALYRFHVLVDDGARLWIDSQLIIDEWRGGPVRELTADASVAAGQHTVKVEFEEFAGEARLKVWWEKLPTPTPTATASLTPVPPTATFTPVPPTATFTPTATPSATNTATATNTPAPTPTGTATPTPTPTATSTNTPQGQGATPSDTPTPTDTPGRP